jgi:hypothetical protein
LALFSRRSP